MDKENAKEESYIIEEITKLLKENSSKSNEKEIVDTNEASKILGRCKRTLQSYRDEGLIPFSQRGKGAKIWFKKCDLIAFINESYC